MIKSYEIFGDLSMRKRIYRKTLKSKRHLSIVSDFSNQNLEEKHPPGSFVNLDNQPSDLPPFQVITCDGGRCFVRQQSWGNSVQWEVDSYRLKAA